MLYPGWGRVWGRTCWVVHERLHLEVGLTGLSVPALSGGAGAPTPMGKGVVNAALALRAGSRRSSTSMGELVGAVDSCPGATLAGVASLVVGCKNC